VCRSLALILLGTVVLGVTSIEAGSGAISRTRVTLFGDSIAASLETQPSARRALARGIDLDLQAAVCRRTVGESCPYLGSRTPTLVALLPSLRLGQAAVVATGYNDSESTFAETIEAALAALEDAGVEHVLWLTLRAERQSYLQMNVVLQAAAAVHSRLTLIDWNVYSRSHPDWFQPDGLHLTTAGATAMATLVHRALDDLGLVASPPSPAFRIATRHLPTAHLGRHYAARLTTTGGTSPIRWARTSVAMPAGLTLRSNGLLAGTPVVAGRRLIVMRATDAAGRFAVVRLALAVTP